MAVASNNWGREVIYQIFIDRFAGYDAAKDSLKPQYVGGNIAAIIDKLAYLQDLGVSSVWLSPFFTGQAYHGYHITDFYGVDPHFGAEEDVQNLIDHVHRNNMKIFCDFVPNHCSNQHPYFLDAVKNSSSQYRQWFIFDSWPNKYMKFKQVKELVKLNLDYEPALDHMIGAARKWLQVGFDGFRLDHVVGLSNQNLGKLLLPLRHEFPKAVFFGEAWLDDITFKDLRTLGLPRKHLLWALNKLNPHTAKDILYQNYIGLLDGILDFEVADRLEAYAKTSSHKKMEHIKKRMIKHSIKYQGKLLLFTFLDNHDMDRFLYRCNQDVRELEKALKQQLNLDQPAIIYYGTEVGMTQQSSFASRPDQDILARQPMAWETAKQNTELLEFCRQQIKQRAET